MALNYLAVKYLDELEDYFDANGQLPPAKQLRPNFINKPEFLVAMRSRGLPVPTNVPGQLTPTHKALIKSISNYSDRRPIRKKLQDFDVTYTEYQKLLKNPLFTERLEAAVEKAFLSETSLEAKIGISRLVQEADLGAIKYFHEFTGQFKPNEVSLLNLSLILAKLMEILVTYVEPGLLPEVADKLEAVVLQTTSTELVQRTAL